jgi:hypothetical protein
LGPISFDKAFSYHHHIIFLHFFRRNASKKISALIVFALNLFLSFVMKMPAVENALSASIDEGGIVFRALNNFPKFSGLFLVDSKRAIFLKIILSA